jgi:hypothetical protein
MLSLRTTLIRLTDRSLLPEEPVVSAKNLCISFRVALPASLRSLLKVLNSVADAAAPAGGSVHPYYRRRTPVPQYPSSYESNGYFIELADVPLAWKVNPQKWLDYCVSQFDARAAMAILDNAKPSAVLSAQKMAVGDQTKIAGLSNLYAQPDKDSHLLQPGPAVLGMMAYNDFFPGDKCTLAKPIPFPSPPGVPTVAPGAANQSIGSYLRDLIDVGLRNCRPGYCGTMGIDDANWLDYLLHDSQGNYDMGQTNLVALAYSYFDELSDQTREYLITQLLARGIVRRPNEADLVTSGPPPNDWTRAGRVPEGQLVGAIVSLSGIVAGLGPAAAAIVYAAIAALEGYHDIGETENHIISMLSTRYLTNQLLYQRTLNPVFDNRRATSDGGFTCFSLVLSELRNILRCDFAEYNAKDYQDESRWPIVNLATYAYDHEVRLAARMALDYVSAHIAVSSNDLRRLVPFRRKNVSPNNNQATVDNQQRSSIALIDPSLGADPMGPYFAIQAGNVRGYVTPNNQPDQYGNPARSQPHSIAGDGGSATLEIHGSWRLPPLVQDLFVNDLHRRFFQRLHRTSQDEAEKQRNCENYELYAGSPSYLITAGGEPSTYALNPTIVSLPIFGDIPLPDQGQQKGVAMPTTFMPTGQFAAIRDQFTALDLIQFSHFSDVFDDGGKPAVKNYGVAPDFACGHDPYLPPWVKNNLVPPGLGDPPFSFGRYGPDRYNAEFYLAIYQDGDYGLLEAYDLWLHPGVTMEEFRRKVLAQNGGLNLHVTDGSGKIKAEQNGHYVTFGGTHIDFKIWNKDGSTATAGALTYNIVYGAANPTDAIGDAGNNTTPFLNGTVLNSPNTAVVELTNSFFGSPGAKIVLDHFDVLHPRRVSETGEVEQAGFNNEVWVNFGWRGPFTGDFYQPFNTLAAAIANVADGGVIRLVPGWTNERLPPFGKKRFRLVAPIGGVRIGVR